VPLIGGPARLHQADLKVRLYFVAGVLPAADGL
jgi:hypothetical protein